MFSALGAGLFSCRATSAAFAEGVSDVYKKASQALNEAALRSAA